jgi:hypothetical protein
MKNKKLVPFILLTYSNNILANDHLALSVQYTEVLALALMALGVLLATVAVVIERIYRLYPPEKGIPANNSAAIKKSMNSMINTPYR